MIGTSYTYDRIALHRHEGYRLEKDGKLPEALVAYLLSIQIGEKSDDNMFYAYRFSYDMAISIARKLMLINLEVELINALFRHKLLPNEQNIYLQRLKDIAI